MCSIPEFYNMSLSTEIYIHCIHLIFSPRRLGSRIGSIVFTQENAFGEINEEKEKEKSCCPQQVVFRKPADYSKAVVYKCTVKCGLQV